MNVIDQSEAKRPPEIPELRPGEAYVATPETDEAGDIVGWCGVVIDLAGIDDITFTTEYDH